MAAAGVQAAHSTGLRLAWHQHTLATVCRRRFTPVDIPAHNWRRQRQTACTASSDGGSGTSSGSGSGDTPGAPRLPTSSAGVAGWAASTFREAASSNLVKALLALSLEEAAASQAASAATEGVAQDDSALRGSVGSAGTWSLERLAGLADEVAVVFYAQLSELGVTEGILQAAPGLPDPTLLTLHMDLVRSYPMQLISAVNHVLFERHGYRRQRRFGDPLDSRLSNVLENGNGTSGSLAVLYMEICERLSLPLQPVALDGGRYFVLIPADGSIHLGAGGESFCIDAYSEGMLLSQAEACELFEVEAPLQACGSELMLAGILRVLLDSHWCQAVGCPPEPLLMVPIDVQVALGEYQDVEVSTSSGEDSEGDFFRVSFAEPVAGLEGRGGAGPKWWPRQGYHLQRALAAAQKRSWLLPKDLRAQLEFSLCLYFDKRYDDAWQELGCAVQAAKSEPPEHQTFSWGQLEQMEVLLEKVRLQLAFAGS